MAASDGAVTVGAESPSAARSAVNENARSRQKKPSFLSPEKGPCFIRAECALGRELWRKAQCICSQIDWLSLSWYFVNHLPIGGRRSRLSTIFTYQSDLPA